MPVGDKNRCLAAVLLDAIAPGAGHMVRGRPLRGAAWLGVIVLCILLAPRVPQVVLPIMLVWLAMLVDAARMDDGGTWFESPAVMAIAGAWVVGSLALMLGIRAVYVEAFKLPSAGMAPTLAIGDHMFADKTAYWFGSPARGDVVVFKYPCKRTVTFVKRVIAVGGDTVEVRCKRTYVNGKALEMTAATGTCAYWDRSMPNDRWSEESCHGYREAGAYQVAFSSPVTAEPDAQDFPSVSDGEAPRVPGCFDGAGGAPAPKGTLEPNAQTSTEPCAPRLAYRIPDGHVFVMGDNRDNSADSRYWGVVPVGDVKGKVRSIWWSQVPREAGGVRWGRIGSVR